MPPLSSSEVERVFREEYGRAVAVLVRLCGEIGAAEEAVQDAFIAGYKASSGDSLVHAIRADLLRRLGRGPEAALAYEAAMVRTDNAAERRFLERRLRAVAQG